MLFIVFDFSKGVRNFLIDTLVSIPLVRESTRCIRNFVCQQTDQTTSNGYSQVVSFIQSDVYVCAQVNDFLMIHLQFFVMKMMTKFVPFFLSIVYSKANENQSVDRYQKE